MTLSIVLTALNDPHLTGTVQSIRDTAGDAPEIIIVNDAGSFPDHSLAALGCRLINNNHRLGVGPSRYVGCVHATGDHILIGDSHLRFLPGWYEQTVARLEAHPKTLFCFECRGLDSQHLDVAQPKSCYYGGTWHVFGPDPNAAYKTRVFETVWNKDKLKDNAELPCVLGGAYAASRDWMLACASSLRFLKSWGQDESILSIHSWLRGGDCRIITATGIGHIFPIAGKEKQPYTVPKGHPDFNRLFTLYTLLPDDLCDWLLEKWLLVRGGGELSEGKKILEQHAHIVETERAKNHVEFIHDFYWLAVKFGLNLPV